MEVEVERGRTITPPSFCILLVASNSCPYKVWVGAILSYCRRSLEIKTKSRIITSFHSKTFVSKHKICIIWCEIRSFLSFPYFFGKKTKKKHSFYSKRFIFPFFKKHYSCISFGFGCDTCWLTDVIRVERYTRSFYL